MLLSVLTILLGLSLGKEFLVETANSASDGLDNPEAARRQFNYWNIMDPPPFERRRGNPEPNPAEAARRQFRGY